MTTFVSVILVGSLLALIGIVTWMPLVVVGGTLLACGTLLLALINYFDTLL